MVHPLGRADTPAVHETVSVFVDRHNRRYARGNVTSVKNGTFVVHYTDDNGKLIRKVLVAESKLVVWFGFVLVTVVVWACYRDCSKRNRVEGEISSIEMAFLKHDRDWEHAVPSSGRYTGRSNERDGTRQENDVSLEFTPNGKNPRRRIRLLGWVIPAQGEMERGSGTVERNPPKDLTWSSVGGGGETKKKTF